jgi:hypothetical protein
MGDEHLGVRAVVRSVRRPDLVLPEVAVMPPVAARLPQLAALRLPLADVVVRPARLPLRGVAAPAAQAAGSPPRATVQRRRRR